MMEPDISLERAWHEINRAAREQYNSAPQATVEALMRDLRHCGTKALEEPATKRRLSELSDDQIVQVGNRLHRLRPEIAQMDSRGSGNFVSGEAQTMTDTTFVDAREIFEKVKGEEAAKRQAESDGSWPVMDAAAFYGLAGEVFRVIAPDSESELSFAPHGDDCVSMSLGTSGHWR